MPDGFFLAVTIFLGLCLGSFATALSWRLPRGVSIGVERSKCPSCQRVLGIPDLVPVFSWLFLRGRCRTCRAPIGWSYPLIELATLLLCIGFYERFGFSASTLALFLLAPVVMAIADIDLGYKIIPDSLNLAVLLLGGLVLAINAFSAADPALFLGEQGTRALGGLALYGFCALALRSGVMTVMKKEPLGLGDVKFFAVSGFWLGPDLEAFAHFMMVSGLLGVAFALSWKKIRHEAEFPFGPALLAAFLIVLLWQPPGFIFL